MTALMIIHQILNRKWITALFKGKYTPARTAQTAINAALAGAFPAGRGKISDSIPFFGISLSVREAGPEDPAYHNFNSNGT